MNCKSISIPLLMIMLAAFLGAENTEPALAHGIAITKFIPGLHQLISGKILKGGVLLGACLTTIAGAIIENNRGDKYYEQYLESTDVDEIIELRNKAEHSFKARNYYILGMVSLWLVHALDLKIFKTKRGVIKGEAKNNSIHVAVYYSF